MNKEERLNVADKGGYHKEEIKKTIRDDYFRTLVKNGSNVSKTLRELSEKYGRSETGIRYILQN